MSILASGRPPATGASCLQPTPSPPQQFADRQRLAGLRCEYRRIARRLADPDVELDSDTAADVVTTVDRLRAAGGTLDVMLVGLVEQLRLQLADACLDG